MRSRFKSVLGVKSILGVGLITLFASGGKVFGFTQGVQGGGWFVPMGHEWITRLAAIELLDGPSNDAGDPRLQKDWKRTETNLDLSAAKQEVARLKQQTNSDKNYVAKYQAVYDAIMGERWVDIGGVNYPKAAGFDKHNCLDLVTQEPTEVQYDHFMRRWNDTDALGGKTAADGSVNAFIKYFKAAATAADGTMVVWDGGGYAEQRTVDRHYFLFGRALHLLEDSFSPDHTVRVKDDGYRRVRQVKSYLCAMGSEQHAHEKPNDWTFGEKFWLTGDVIWRTTTGGYSPSNMREEALAATEATKDAWAAFIRTMAKPAGEARRRAAEAEAKAIAKRWLSYDQKELLTWYTVDNGKNRHGTYVWATGESGGGTSQEACMARDWEGKTQAAKLKEFQDGQRLCLFNMRPVDYGADTDPSLRIAYNWQWRASSFETPPESWKIGDKQDSQRVKLRSRLDENGYVRREDSYLYNDPKTGTTATEFLIGPNREEVAFMVADMPNNYINTSSGGTGWANIWSSASKGHFRLVQRPDGYYNIINTSSQQYLWSSNDKPYISGKEGDNKNAQWEILGLPKPFPLDGTYRVFSADKTLALDPSGKLQGQKYAGVVNDNMKFVVERQDDGSFLFGMGGGYLQVNPGDSSVSVTPGKTGEQKRFRIERIRTGLDSEQYAIRNVADKRYWRLLSDASGPYIVADVSTDCWAIDPCNPVITGPEHGGKGDGIENGSVPEECGQQPVKPPRECPSPSSFLFNHY